MAFLRITINYRMERNIITQFQKFGLTPELIRSLTKMNFQVPSPVQKASIKPMLDRQDMLVQAPTGTGKTAAFGIPIVENTNPQSRHVQTVILCPTRELAVQTASVLRQLTTFKPGVRTLALYGGEQIQRQITALKRRPQIIVATPGRLMDHIKRRTLRLNQVDCIVLDEADRMLDMGFRDDIGTILESVPTERQTVLFSATLSDEIKAIASTHQNNAQQVQIKQKTLTVDKVEQYYSEVKGNAKNAALLSLLEKNQFELLLVFVATKVMADTLAQQLTDSGHPAEAIHGDLHQRQRDRVMQRYRTGRVKILVATDVAARGIDVNGIDAVVNYDIPGDSDSYVHRIGRTGRQGRSGVSYTFIYPRERGKLRGIMEDTKATILPMQLLPGQQTNEITAEGNRNRKSAQKTNRKPSNKSSRKSSQRFSSTSQKSTRRAGQNSMQKSSLKNSQMSEQKPSQKNSQNSANIVSQKASQKPYSKSSKRRSNNKTTNKNRTYAHAGV